ncbi:Rrf2 family transcriptional regulator [Nitratireductor mangrovi]|uniref:Rrf2 family transcriptional regulator n=1 Tax=Nitratireductor mangrovi TaxID=2599600 RepID=A0A5B8KXN6_9HYPH|nr:Rrf2 family transcriptional regulator [Nitratireductor mangrovi]QDZ00230.1 Rrf2 family transcriptional regulator [Nitratireductor mangrovi]
MKLTLHTDYALRMLIFLAVHEGRPATVSDVATTYGLSRNHLLKVALKLGKHGYVRTARGRYGGISLAAPPEDINLGRIVRATEDGFALVECLGADGGACAISPACTLKGIVGKAVEAFLAVFDDHTLADLVGNRTLLKELLEIPGDPARAA